MHFYVFNCSQKLYIYLCTLRKNIQKLSLGWYILGKTYSLHTNNALFRYEKGTTLKYIFITIFVLIIFNNNLLFNNKKTIKWKYIDHHFNFLLGLI